MSNRYTIYTPPPHTILHILFQDEHLLVVNKPAGLLSVPGKGLEKQDCLVSRCAAEFGEIHVAHRLDMSTSGIIVFARSKDAVRAMNQLFAGRDVSKTYIAVVDGLIEQDSGEINAPLMVDWPNRPKQKIDAEGKPSHTHYKVIDRNEKTNTSRVELIPITGRSHQLRVHMMFLGHAILGDEFYASDAAFQKSERLLLHATQLHFIHPFTEQPLHIQCPPDF
ncbi:RluA family pseudouridine synthase [Ghiorsea bivora]|uniref:RluA family pseudouridine synthase n=1 Tax=Ghiorsea bivora TaxID=1485545 RepID=UPI00068A1B08|nr:RluA family pseudouridine synthase [Ghiorsea bivora]